MLTNRLQELVANLERLVSCTITAPRFQIASANDRESDSKYHQWYLLTRRPYEALQCENLLQKIST